MRQNANTGGCIDLNEAIAIMKRYSENHDWLNRNFKELQKYGNKFVAIDNGGVIASADTRDEVEEKVKGRKGVYIEMITADGILWLL
jgi:hypothetical protein